MMKGQLAYPDRKKGPTIFVSELKFQFSLSEIMASNIIIESITTLLEGEVNAIRGSKMCNIHDLASRDVDVANRGQKDGIVNEYISQTWNI